MQEILNNRSNYCYVLFDFIEFDPIKEKHTNNSLINTPRESVNNQGDLTSL